MLSLGRRCAPLLLLLTACGGGGGGPFAPSVVDLGLAASTTPTTYLRRFANPFGVPATASVLATSGPFGVQPGALPVQVGAAGEVDVPVVFTPAGPGAFSGQVSVRFESAGTMRDADERYVVSAEGARITATPTALAFGDLGPGQASTRISRIRNDSAASPVTFTNLTVPSAEFTLLSPSLPFTVAPGSFVDATFRVQSATGAALSGLARLGLGDPGGPLDFVASANLEARELITDLGRVTFGAGGVTPTLQFSMPADGAAFMIEASAGSNDRLGLSSLTGPGGKVYENSASTGDYVWSPGYEVFTAQVPNTDRASVQLVPGGGTYSFALRRYSGFTASVNVRVLVERRPGGANPTTVLDLNVWLAKGLEVPTATAPTHARLQEVLSGIAAILAAQGVTLGDVDYYNVTDPLLDAVSDSEFPTLLRLSSTASETRLNLFFVQQAIGGGVVGVAGMVGGPKLNGTGASGVMSVFHGYSASLIALVAAHELGHFLGLWHTTESTGSHDFMDDTLECQANGSGGPCSSAGGGYLMHWQALGGTTLTNGQGVVIRGHPLMEPGTTAASKPAAGKLAIRPALQAPDPMELLTLAPGWCGTCGEQGCKPPR